MSCLSHSVAQLRQACAHNAQMACMCSPPLAIEAAASWQRSAHSRSNAMQRAIGLESASWRQAVAHFRHSVAQSLHARRQASSISLGMSIPQSATRFRSPSIAACECVDCASAYPNQSPRLGNRRRDGFAVLSRLDARAEAGEVDFDQCPRVSLRDGLGDDADAMAAGHGEECRSPFKPSLQLFRGVTDSLSLSGTSGSTFSRSKKMKT